MYRVLEIGMIGLLVSAPALEAQRGPAFTMEQIKSYPFPNELTASSTGSKNLSGHDMPIGMGAKGYFMHL